MNIGNKMIVPVYLKIGLKIKDKQLQRWEKNVHRNAWEPILKNLCLPVQNITHPTLIINNITL